MIYCIKQLKNRIRCFIISNMTAPPIEVTLSDDELQAFLNYSGPASEPPLNETRLKFLLRGQGVVSGIDEQALAAAVVEINAGRPVRDLLVAKGTPAKQGRDALMELHFEVSSKPQEDESGRINYREIGALVMARAGQLLAVKHKARGAVNGVTVTGKVLLMPKAEDIALTAGVNVEQLEEDEKIVFNAREDGVIKLENNILSVFPELDIDKDVDFNCGNIDFSGDVRIGRDVLPDFIVKAAGRIIIWGSAVACRLDSGQDIEVRAGIVGKGKGVVKSAGSIKAGFVENATLEALGDITVRSGIIGSSVKCNGMLKVDTRGGRIVESSVKAGRGIIVGNVGSRFSSATVLITGIIGDKETVWLEAKQKLEDKITEAQGIERRYGRSTLENKSLPPGFLEKCRKDLELWDTLKEEIRQIHEQVKEIEEEMFDYQAVIVIKEQLFPKVTLKIGRHELVSGREYQRATVRYSPEEDRLIIV